MAKKHRERNEETVSLEIIDESSEPLSIEMRTLLEAARIELEEGMKSDMRTLERTLSERLDAMGERLRAARAELESVRRQTTAMKNDPLHEIVRTARERLSGV